jgi:hypothetical protein
LFGDVYQKYFCPLCSAMLFYIKVSWDTRSGSNIQIVLIPFQVKWYRDTMLLDPNEYRLMEKFGIRHTLVLRRVAEDDFGNYSCSAENSLGKSRAFIELSGKYIFLNVA